ncbi:MAG: hypothetical protein RR840_01800 [Clostridium sp.]
MRSLINSKVALLTINIIEILLVTTSIIVYSSVFSFIPWYNMIPLEVILLITFLYLLLSVSLNYIGIYTVIPEKGRIITLSLTLVSFISIVLIEIWNYQYSLVRIIAICNLAFCIIVVCELFTTIISQIKGKK